MSSDLKSPVPQVADAANIPLARYERQAYDYTASEQNGDETEQAYLGSKLALHNDRMPHMVLQKESPQHRIILYLKAQGKTNAEIAQATGYTAVWVSQICRQPFFRKQLVEMCNELGTRAVEAVLKGEMLNCVQTLIEVRDDPNQKGPTRVAAVNSLMDRYYGKPVQRVETENVTQKLDDVKAESARLDQELAELEAQLPSLNKN